MTLLDNLRVGLFVPNTGTLNEIRNPSGENGTTSGWEEVNTLDLTASATSDGPLDHGIAGPKFIGATAVSGGPVGKAQTIGYPYVISEWVAVKYEVPYVDGFYRVGFQFLASNGAVQETSQSGYLTAGGAVAYGAIQAAAFGIESVRVVFWHYSTNTGTAATAGQELIFRNVQLGIAATALEALDIVDRGEWHDDILGPHTSLSITRRPMERGSVGAVLDSARLPAGRDAELKPGAGYRIRLGSEDLVSCLLVERRPEESNRPQPLTVLEGADNVRVLQVRPEYRVTEGTFGTLPLEPLWEVFSDSEIPWKINGSSAAGPGMEGEGVVNTNMTAIDQVVLARDSNAPAYAWFDRAGIGIVNDLANMPVAPVATVNESVYSQFVTGFNMDACFNQVTVKRITGEDLGTYVDAESVEEWGERPVTVRVPNQRSSVQSLAQTFLDLNKDPVFQVLSVQIPLHRISNTAVALLDLYDTVTVKNKEQGIDEDYWVTSIHHEITPERWILTLGFTVPGIAAIPQVLPDMPT